MKNLFCRIGVEEITIVGFDGYFKGKKNYFNSELENSRREEEFKELNKSISKMLQALMKRCSGKKIFFLTHSYFERFLEFQEV